MLLNRSEGILAQRQFFEANNPFQFVVGSGLSINQAKYEVETAKVEFKISGKRKVAPKRTAQA